MSMDRRLYHASLTGDVNSLLELLEEDELILDRVIAACVPETPLHIAAIRGHVDFAREVLRRKLNLAHELNSQGLSPLHLACANGYVDLVKGLLIFVPNISMNRNREGRTPLHAAAMKGRVEVLDELTRFKPEWTRELTSREETVLHLCVKHDQVEALKMLVGLVADDGFVNQKDVDGNTILHLAAANKQIPAITFLLSETKVDINAMNASDLTALDVSAVSHGVACDMEIREILRQNGAKRAKEMVASHNRILQGNNKEMSPTLDHISAQRSHSQRFQEMNEKWMHQMMNAVMVAAVLIATVTFQAGLTPPGGLWQADSDKDVAGTSILASKNHAGYILFMSFNTVAFVASVFVILMSAIGFDLRRRRMLKMYLLLFSNSIWMLLPTFGYGVMAGYEGYNQNYMMAGGGGAFLLYFPLALVWYKLIRNQEIWLWDEKHVDKENLKIEIRQIS